MTDDPGWTVTIEGSESFPSLRGETILQAARRAGVLLPSGCRYGACRTCAVQVVRGQVSQRAGTALTEEHLERNYVLACTASAQSDCILRVETDEPWIEVLPWTE